MSSLARADQLFQERSFAHAAGEYAALLESGEVLAPRLLELRFRLAECLARMERWEEALALALSLARDYCDSVWEPAALHWIARLYLVLPNEAWREEWTDAEGTRRAGPLCWTEADRGRGEPSTPNRDWVEVAMSRQKWANALAALEAALICAPLHRHVAGQAEAEIRLCYDAIEVLGMLCGAWAEQGEWRTAGAADAAVDPTAAYAEAWPLPVKLLYLFARIRMLANGLPRHEFALADSLFEEARCLQQYHGEVRRHLERLTQPGAGSGEPLAYPLRERSPIEPLRRLVQEHRTHPLRELAALELAYAQAAEGRMGDALAEFRALAQSARARGMRELATVTASLFTQRALRIRGAGTQLPGEPLQLTLQYRNVRRVVFELFDFNLATAHSVRRPRVERDDALEGLDLTSKQARLFCRERVLRHEVELPAGDAYCYGTQTVELPPLGPGAYFVKAQTADPDGGRLETGFLLLVTDLVLVQQEDRNGLLYFAADARTGRPVSGARLQCRQAAGAGWKRTASLLRGTTGAEGLGTLKLVHSPDDTIHQIDALAQDGRRFATVSFKYRKSVEKARPHASLRTFVYTDRPIYRPGQTLYYRCLLLREEGGAWTPFVGQEVCGEIRDRSHGLIARIEGKTGPFGTLSGQAEIPAEAPLGNGSIWLELGTDGRASWSRGTCFFAVEEYRKPELEVSVTPDGDGGRLGGAARMRVHASHYDGAPAQDARVSYTVVRTQVGRRPWPDRDTGFFSAYPAQSQYSDHDGSTVATGELLTDAHGEAFIDFEADASAGPGGGRVPEEATFRIDVEVTDSNRRTVEGSGTVCLTRSDLRVRLRALAGYFRRDEPVQVEVECSNLAGRGIAVTGCVRVFRPAPDGKTETQLTEWALELDHTGKGLVQWPATDGGPFRLEFAVRDRKSLEASARAEVWVAEDWASLWSAAGGLQLRLKEREHEENGVARVLVTAPAEDSYVLLFRESGGVIRDSRVLHLPTGVHELELPLRRGDFPNLFLTAITVRDGRVHQRQLEIRVAPTTQLMHVTVEPDRARYRPGERALVTLRATDWEGRPVQAELSLGVTDAALEALRRSVTPDFRTLLCRYLRTTSLLRITTSASHTIRVGAESRVPEKHLRELSFERPLLGRLAEWHGIQCHYHAPDHGLCFEPPHSTAWHAWRAGLDFRHSMNAREYLCFDAPVGAASPSYEMYDACTISEIASPYPSEPMPSPEDMRTRFADTAFWHPAICTGADGTAAVEIAWPDNLTEWCARAVGVSTRGLLAQAEACVRTGKEVTVRLQAPRFLVEGDEVTLSALVHSELPQLASLQARLELEHPDFERPGDAWGSFDTPERTVELAPGGEARLDWRVRVRCPGPLRARVSAWTQEAGDGMELMLPVYRRGVERSQLVAGTLREEAEARIVLELPQQRQPGSAEVLVRITPSLASTVLDALPYLIDYPHGCVEQTASRFLAAAIAKRMLVELGVTIPNLKDRSRLLQEREQAGESEWELPGDSPYTAVDGRTGLLTLAAGRAVLHDPARLDAVIRKSLQRLRKAQTANGGWGWWPGGPFNPEVTVYVLEGLCQLYAGQVELPDGMMSGAIRSLGRYLQASLEEAKAVLAYTELIAAAGLRRAGAAESLVSAVVQRCFPARDQLGTRWKAVLARLCHETGRSAEAQTVLRNLETTLQVDPHRGTAWWDAPAAYGWQWEGNPVETAAAALEAYLLAAPDAPVVPMLARWLVENRRGTAWRSTRETALVVQALLAYAASARELEADYTLLLELGAAREEYRIHAGTILSSEQLFVVPDAQLHTGEQSLTVRRSGSGTVYYTVLARYFSQEDPIPASGHGIQVTRRYFRVPPPVVAPKASAAEPVDPPPLFHRVNPFLTGQFELLEPPPVALRTTRGTAAPDRVPLSPGDPIASGELLEVEVTLDADNEYGYVLVEDIKPAGTEPLDPRSGYRWDGAGAYVEYRDQKVAFFLEQVPQGRTRLTYRTRAEVPGKLGALPVQAFAMYAPEVRATSDEQRLLVRDS